MEQLGVTRKPPGWGWISIVRLTHQMVEDLLRSSATKVVYMNRRSGALFTALYLKQCAVTLQQAYGGITPYDIHTKLSVPVSLTRSEVRDWLRGLIRKLANRYLSQALSRPREYRGNRLGRLCQRIVSDLPCISIRNDAEAYIERISSLIYGHPLPDILVMNGMPLGEGMK
ncbi:hypothetical protein V6N13_072311 [Hibiscus sabdariffa]